VQAVVKFAHMVSLGWMSVDTSKVNTPSRCGITQLSNADDAGAVVDVVDAGDVELDDAEAW